MGTTSRSKRPSASRPHAGGKPEKPGVFVAEFDLRPALDAVRRDGAAVVAQSLADPFRRRLQRELMEIPFEPAPMEIGPVRQETEVSVVRDLRGLPALAELVRDFAARVRSHGGEIRGLATYLPNEVHLQRYRPGSFGITPHLDGKRYRRLVAFFTTRGRARFTVLRERAGEVLARTSIGAGSLVLLRAPGLGGVRDGRPFHAIAPLGRRERVSVALRMNARAHDARALL